MQHSRERDPSGFVLSRTPLMTPSSPDNPRTSPGFNKKNNNNNNTNSINNNDLGASSPGLPPGAASPQVMAEDGAAGGGVLLHTWHPHVFAKPPRTPTPHRIADILGWRPTTTTPILVTPKPIRPVAALPSPSASPLLVVPRVPLQDAGGVHVADEPLNLTTRSRDASPTSSVTPPPSGVSVVTARTFRDNQVLNGVLNGTLANAVLRVPVQSHVPPGPLQPLRDTASKRRKKDSFSNSGTGLQSAVTSVEVPLVAASVVANDAAGGDTDGSGGASDRKRKKARTTFTGRQIFELEKQFELKKYLSTSERAEMARLLGVTDQQVKIWFQNRRTKWKKHDNISNAEAAEHKAQQVPQQVPVRKEPGAKVGAVSSNRQGLKPPTGSPSSGDEHSNGSMMTGDGSVSESCFSEPDASRSVPVPPVATSPSTASVSPVVPSAIPLEVRTPASPHMSADTPNGVGFSGNTPTLGATAATPPSLPTPAEPSSPPLPLQVPPPPRPVGCATSQIQDEVSMSRSRGEGTGLDQPRVNLSPS